jgi:hypothetical protein
MASGGMIRLPSFIKIGSEIQVILRLLPYKFYSLQCWYYWGEEFICYAIEVALGGTMCIPSFNKNGSSGESILRFRFNNLRASVNIVMWLNVTLNGDLDFILDLGLTVNFNIQLVITLNYSAITNFHTSQITRAHPKSFPACSVFTNNVYSSAPWFKFSMNGDFLLTELSRSQSYITTTVYRPSVHLGAKPLETHDQYFFKTEH